MSPLLIGLHLAITILLTVIVSVLVLHRYTITVLNGMSSGSGTASFPAPQLLERPECSRLVDKSPEGTGPCFVMGRLPRGNASAGFIDCPAYQRADTCPRTCENHGARHTGIPQHILAVAVSRLE